MARFMQGISVVIASLALAACGGGGEQDGNGNGNGDGGAGNGGAPAAGNESGGMDNAGGGADNGGSGMAPTQDTPAGALNMFIDGMSDEDLRTALSALLPGSGAHTDLTGIVDMDRSGLVAQQYAATWIGADFSEAGQDEAGRPLYEIVLDSGETREVALEQMDDAWYIDAESSFLRTSQKDSG